MGRAQGRPFASFSNTLPISNVPLHWPNAMGRQRWYLAPGHSLAPNLPPPPPPDFARIAGFLHEVLEECKAVQRTSGKKLVDFVK